MSMNQVELKAFEKQTAGGMGRVSLRVTCRELPAGLWVWVGVAVRCHAGLPVTWVGVVCLLCSLTCCTGCLWGREWHAGNNGCNCLSLSWGGCSVWAVVDGMHIFTCLYDEWLCAVSSCLPFAFVYVSSSGSAGSSLENIAKLWPFGWSFSKNSTCHLIF